MKYSRLKQIIKEEVQKVVEEKQEPIYNFNALRDLYTYLKQTLHTEGMYKLTLDRINEAIIIKNPDRYNTIMENDYDLKITVKGDNFAITAGSLFEGIKNKTEEFGLREFNKILKFCQVQLNQDQ